THRPCGALGESFMLKSFRSILFPAFAFAVFAWVFCFSAIGACAQSSGTIEGVVRDQSGLVVPNATIEIHNPVSHFDRSTTTDGQGRFRFTTVPFNPYHLMAKATGFAEFAQDVEVRSLVTVSIEVKLIVATAETSVTVEEGADLIER